MTKTWEDQPELCTGAPVVASMWLNEHAVEVRELAGGRFAVTLGNLFGSQTLLCADALVVLRLLHLMSNNNAGKRISPPDGAEIVS